MEIYQSGQFKKLSLNLYGTPVTAGFPSPADDYLDTQLDLNEHLIKHPAATFFVRASGNSMINAGIYTGDILVVDRANTAQHNDVVIAVVNGEFTVKRLSKRNGQVILQPENPDFKPIFISPSDDFQVWGVVTYVIHKPQ